MALPHKSRVLPAPQPVPRELFLSPFLHSHLSLPLLTLKEQTRGSGLQVWQPPLPFPNAPAPLSPARLSLEAFGGASRFLAAPGGPSGPGGGRAHPAALPRSGWIAALSELHGNLAVAIIMMVVAAFFTLCAVLSLFLLKQVSSSRGWGPLWGVPAWDCDARGGGEAGRCPTG